jgi:hypothetical protein
MLTVVRGTIDSMLDAAKLLKKKDGKEGESGEKGAEGEAASESDAAEGEHKVKKNTYADPAYWEK